MTAFAQSVDHAAADPVIRDPREDVDVRMGYDAWLLGCGIGDLRNDVEQCSNAKVLNEAVECCDKAIADLIALKSDAEAKITRIVFDSSAVPA